MFELYSQLSKAVDVYNENVKEEIEYYEVLEMMHYSRVAVYVNHKSGKVVALAVCQAHIARLNRR